MTGSAPAYGISPFYTGNHKPNAFVLERGAGIAAGFAYWAVAGWSAGFWRPVFPRNDKAKRGD